MLEAARNLRRLGPAVNELDEPCYRSVGSVLKTVLAMDELDYGFDPEDNWVWVPDGDDEINEHILGAPAEREQCEGLDEIAVWTQQGHEGGSFWLRSTCTE